VRLLRDGGQVSNDSPATASAAPDVVLCNAGDVNHEPHLWTFADDYPLMQCPGVLDALKQRDWA
jgi:hypothetical protein